MIKVTKHIGYIDALKGLAAIMVFMGHFMLAFPLLQNLKEIPVIKEFVNGLFPVHTFILLAGFSLCCSLQNKDPQRSIATLVAKRYFRFVVPLVIPTLLAFVLCNCGWGSNQQWGEVIQSDWMKQFLPPSASFKDLFRSLFYAPVMITPLINPLWMLKYIFIGTFLAVPFYIGTREIRKRWVKYGLILMFMLLLSKVTIFYTSMLAGVLTYYIYQENVKLSYMGLLCLVAFCGLTFLSFGNIDSVRAFLFVVGFTLFPKSQAILTNKVCLWLGSISFEIYLLHSLVICSLGCYMALTMENAFLSVCCILVSCIIVVFACSYMLSKADLWLNTYMVRTIDKLLK